MADTQQRADPFADNLDLSDFQPAASRKPRIPKEVVRQVSEANNFPSRVAEAPKAAPVKTLKVQRRRRTGRNVQFNLKATSEVVARFTAVADRDGLVFGELLEFALDAYEKQQKPK